MSLSPCVEAFNNGSQSSCVGDIPNLEWDDSFDPPNWLPPPIIPNFGVPVETRTENLPIDDDSWWYSDANTPNSKYEEWFLSTGQWLLKPKSRRYRGVLTEGQRSIGGNPYTELNGNCFRDRCGDDDVDDFRSVHSSDEEPTERLVLSSSNSEKSFQSVRESEDQFIDDEIDADLHSQSNVLLCEPEVFHTPRPITPRPIVIVNNEQPIPDYSDIEEASNIDVHLIKPGVTINTYYNGYPILQLYGSLVGEREIDADYKEIATSVKLGPNPFQYRQSTESLHSKILGPFRTSNSHKTQLSSEGITSSSSLNENRGTLLNPLSSDNNASSLLSSSTQEILKRKLPYTLLPYCDGSDIDEESNLKNPFESVKQKSCGQPNAKVEEKDSKLCLDCRRNSNMELQVSEIDLFHKDLSQSKSSSRGSLAVGKSEQRISPSSSTELRERKLLQFHKYWNPSNNSTKSQELVRETPSLTPKHINDIVQIEANPKISDLTKDVERTPNSKGDTTAYNAIDNQKDPQLKKSGIPLRKQSVFIPQSQPNQNKRVTKIPCFKNPKLGATNKNAKYSVKEFKPLVPKLPEDDVLLDENETTKNAGGGYRKQHNDKRAKAKDLAKPKYYP